MAKSRKLYVLDLSTANPEELLLVKETLSDILDRVFSIACGELDKGNLYGCPHTHLEVALKKEALDIPCDLCETAHVPEGEVIH